MSSENDVPLGEEARNYYEQQFGNRIHQIKKGGGSAPQRNSSGPSWGGGRAGCGVVFAVIFLLRLIFLFVRTQSSTPSYDYSTTQQPPFHVDMEKRIDNFAGKGNDDEELQRILERLRQQAEKPEPDFRKPNGDEEPDFPERLLTEADVPLLEGLCYRIHQESLQHGATPGKRICIPLPPPAQQRLMRAARGEQLRDDEQRKLLLALDTVLHDANLYELEAFAKVPGARRLVQSNGKRGNPVLGTPRFNRLLLEKCYPDQIVPWKERDLVNAWGRAQWKRRARSDLEKAQREFEPGKH
ncbi:MAG TPA: hypothetical protein VMG10_14545 [Gemmataceae bacterium]|nr:hypothetical protein [Gemmataceae bacterium]